MTLHLARRAPRGSRRRCRRRRSCPSCRRAGRVLEQDIAEPLGRPDIEIVADRPKDACSIRRCAARNHATDRRGPAVDLDPVPPIAATAARRPLMPAKAVISAHKARFSSACSRSAASARPPRSRALARDLGKGDQALAGAHQPLGGSACSKQRLTRFSIVCSNWPPSST